MSEGTEMSDSDRGVAMELRRLQLEVEELRRELAGSGGEGKPRSQQVDATFFAEPQSARRVPGSRTRSFKRHIIIPIHPPRFGTVVHAFSRATCDASTAQDTLLVLLVTSEAERQMFANHLQLTGAQFPLEIEVISAVGLCQTMGLPQTLRSIKENKFNCIVNAKKMIAIYRSVCLGAEEIIAIDSDVIIIGDVAQVFSRLKANFGKKEIVAANGPRNIFIDSADHFLPQDKNKILAMFDDGDLYSWFFDVPYYPIAETASWLADMARTHGSLDAALGRLKWGTFEHLMFHFHLALRHHFKVVDVRSIVGDWYLEDLPMPELLRVIERTGYLPAWANLGGIISFAEPEAVARARDMFLITMHIDRVAGRMD